jgi:hypothetical protein
MKKLGFAFEEVMSGTYTLNGHPDQTGSIRFRGQARAEDVFHYLKNRTAALEGTLDMERFADDVPIRGSLEIRPILGKVIRYEFSFTGNDGHPYRFAGQKDVRLDDLPASMTTLNATIVDGQGYEVARANLHFDVKSDLLPFLVSIRPALS